MTSAAPRTHIISRTLIAVAAAVFVCIGFTSSALAVTLSEARRVSNPGWDLRAAANERGVLITSSLSWPLGQIALDFIPLIGAPTRYIVTASPVGLFIPVGTNGREFLAVYSEADVPKGILLDSAGVPTRTVSLPAIDGPYALWAHAVVLATPEGFDVYLAQDRRVLRVSVHLDGTTSGSWQTVAISEQEIGFFDVLNLPDGNLLISLARVDQCRICTCEVINYPLHVAVTSRDAVVQPLDFSVLPSLASFDVEVGPEGGVWLLGSPDFRLSQVHELLASPGVPILQSVLLATDTDGPGYQYHFELLTRLRSGFVLTESGPGGYMASLRTGSGYEWERLLISSENRVLAAVAGPGGGVAFIIHDYNRQETEVRFLILGRTRGASPVKRVRPSRPE